MNQRNVDSLHTLALQSFLAIAHFDLARLGFRPLGQSDLQNALVIAGFNLFRVHGVRELESANEGAVPALNAMEILFLLFLLKLALALDCECVVFHADVHVLIIQAGNFEFEDVPAGLYALEIDLPDAQVIVEELRLD